jgi:hypothetical protein
MDKMNNFDRAGFIILFNIFFFHKNGRYSHKNVCDICNRAVDLDLSTTQHSQIVLRRFCICDVNRNIFSPYKTYNNKSTYNNNIN